MNHTTQDAQPVLPQTEQQCIALALSIADPDKVSPVSGDLVTLTPAELLRYTQAALAAQQAAEPAYWLKPGSHSVTTHGLKTLNAYGTEDYTEPLYTHAPATTQAACTTNPACHVSSVSSRVCEFGTRHCDVVHAAAPLPTPQAEPVGLPIEQEPKYTTDGRRIINRHSLEAVPHDEPVFVFRARDAAALHALGAYLDHIQDREPLGPHAYAVSQRIEDFKRFAREKPDRMKWPDTATTPPQVAQPLLERECNDADNLLRLLGLEPDVCRTEGGSINMPRVRALLGERWNGHLMGGGRSVVFGPGRESGQVVDGRAAQPGQSGDATEMVAALPAGEVTELVEQLKNIANGIRICGVHDRRFVGDRLDEIARAVLALRPSPAPEWPLRAKVWRRDSTQEWVLEIEGTLEGAFLTCRHTQPLSVPFEDVPGLPTLYKAAPAVTEGEVLEALTALLPDKNDPNHDGHDARDIRKWGSLVERLRTSHLASQAVRVPMTDERLAEVLTTAYGSPEWTMDDVRAARAVEAEAHGITQPQGQRCQEGGAACAATCAKGCAKLAPA